jgi:hypothetical protein
MEATFLEDQQVAALGTLAGQVLRQAVVLRQGFTDAGVLLEDAGDSIGAGEDGFSILPGNRRAAYTAQLFHHLGHI